MTRGGRVDQCGANIETLRDVTRYLGGERSHGDGVVHSVFIGAQGLQPVEAVLRYGRDGASKVCCVATVSRNDVATDYEFICYQSLVSYISKLALVSLSYHANTQTRKLGRHHNQLIRVKLLKPRRTDECLGLSRAEHGTSGMRHTV
jgi:hypothetical protein